MGRSDGTVVKDIPAFEKIIPHLMNKRYDATNYGKFDVDLDKLQALLRQLRLDGHKVGMMDAVITAFALLVRKMPEINRFVANKKVYQRNHLCVSFALIKRQDDGQILETAIKVHIEPEDDLFSISKKIRNLIKENEQPQDKNALDRFVDGLMGLPLLPGFLVGTIKWMDRRGILPKKIIELSPFHTSMFISNLASIQMNYIYHHIYEFGTTSLFIAMGVPRRVYDAKTGETKRVMTLGLALDERICMGAVWAKALYEFRRNLEFPERLLGGMVPEVEESAEEQEMASAVI